MSFILDALKKAESERSRQSGPVLMDVRIAAPRRGLPAWAWALGVVLLANLAVLAWLLLRAPATPVPEAAQAPAVVAPPAAVAAPAPLPAAAAPLPAPLPAPDVLPDPAVTLAEPPGSEAEMEPFMEAPAPAPAAATAPVTRPDGELPTMQDLIAAGVQLPVLQLSWHVYDPAPANRYVLLNSTRLREGDTSPDGIRVERITATGVILVAGGRRFLLAAGG